VGPVAQANHLLESPSTLSQEDLQPFYDFVKNRRVRLERRVEKIFKTLDVDLTLVEETWLAFCPRR
jgi:hypothetical protein